MYKNIIIPAALDHLEILPRKLEVAQRIKSEDGVITVVSVIEDVPAYVAEYTMVRPDRAELGSKAKESLRVALKDFPGVKAELLHGKPRVVLADYTNEVQADLIILAALGPGAEDYALGSTPSRIVRRASCSVMVIR